MKDFVRSYVNCCVRMAASCLRIERLLSPAETAPERTFTFDISMSPRVLEAFYSIWVCHALIPT